MISFKDLEWGSGDSEIQTVPILWGRILDEWPARKKKYLRCGYKKALAVVLSKCGVKQSLQKNSERKGSMAIVHCELKKSARRTKRLRNTRGKQHVMRRRVTDSERNKGRV